MSVTRLLTIADAPALADLARANREFLAPWDPRRREAYFTADGQREVVRNALSRHREGSGLPHAILDETGRLVGRITLSGIVRGPFQSCSMGYWVAADCNGRGLATAAVREIVGVAFGELGLHRIQAETLRHNAGSQRVLERNGFARFGLAPGYLAIASRWQDHILYQLLNTGMAAP
jgi:ribosomal-protein-alanine N-acetyltransferase